MIAAALLCPEGRGVAVRRGNNPATVAMLFLHLTALLEGGRRWPLGLELCPLSCVSHCPITSVFEHLALPHSLPFSPVLSLFLVCIAIARISDGEGASTFDWAVDRQLGIPATMLDDVAPGSFQGPR